jgi:hypothetical protein
MSSLTWQDWVMINLLLLNWIQLFGHDGMIHKLNKILRHHNIEKDV